MDKEKHLCFFDLVRNLSGSPCRLAQVTEKIKSLYEGDKTKAVHDTYVSEGEFYEVDLVKLLINEFPQTDDNFWKVSSELCADFKKENGTDRNDDDTAAGRIVERIIDMGEFVSRVKEGKNRTDDFKDIIRIAEYEKTPRTILELLLSGAGPNNGFTPVNLGSLGKDARVLIKFSSPLFAQLETPVTGIMSDILRTYKKTGEKKITILFGELLRHLDDDWFTEALEESLIGLAILMKVVRTEKDGSTKSTTICRNLVKEVYAERDDNSNLSPPRKTTVVLLDEALQVLNDTITIVK